MKTSAKQFNNVFEAHCQRRPGLDDLGLIIQADQVDHQLRCEEVDPPYA